MLPHYPRWLAGMATVNCSERIRIKMTTRLYIHTAIETFILIFIEIYIAHMYSGSPDI